MLGQQGLPSDSSGLNLTPDSSSSLLQGRSPALSKCAHALNECFSLWSPSISLSVSPSKKNKTKNTVKIDLRTAKTNDSD